MLDKCPLFSNLTKADIARIIPIAPTRKYSKGETIFFENTPADRFFIVSSGKVKVYKISKEGREQVLGIFGEGSTIGEAAMFTPLEVIPTRRDAAVPRKREGGLLTGFSGGHYPAHAEALSDCELFSIGREDFVRLLKTNPEISMRMIGVLSNRLMYFNRLIEDLSLKDVQARLAKFLLDYSIRKNSDSFKLDIKKQDLAQRLGTISETLSRVLRKFRDKRIISIKGKDIAILDRLVLQKILSGVNTRNVIASEAKQSRCNRRDPSLCSG